MKRIIQLMVVLCVGAMLSVFTASAQQETASYVILMKGNSVPARITQDIENAGGTVMHVIPQVGIITALSDNPDFAALIGSIRSVQEIGALPTEALPEAQFSAPADISVPTDVNSSDFLDDGELWGIERVNAPAAWEAGYTGSLGTVVAVIDTGIAWNHPELGANVVFAACYTSQGAVEGFVTNGACNPYPSQSDHGTHVAGTIAGNAALRGVIGVGPDLGLAGYNTFEFIPTCGVCSFSSSRWMAMIDAAERGFDVINMSLGSLGAYGGQGTNGLATFVAADNRVANLVTSLGTTIVASGGNSALDLNGTFINLPGGLPGIVNVGSTGRDFANGDADIRAYYSNYGASIDITAPGGNCGLADSCSPSERPPTFLLYTTLSTIAFVNPTCAATASCTPGYGYKIGTSMAAPHVAGVAGLVADANPELRPNQIVSVLKRTAENLGDRQQYGHGMVSATGALGLD